MTDRLLTEQDIVVELEGADEASYKSDGTTVHTVDVWGLLKAQDAKTYVACNKEWARELARHIDETSGLYSKILYNMGFPPERSCDD